MGWRDEAEKALPAPRPREPRNLRDQILDELADHLACAADEERARPNIPADDDAVWKRVRDRFGDVNAVACQLWFDAMKGTLMRDWINTGMIAVLAVVMVAFMALMMRNMQAMNQQLIGALNAPPAAVDALPRLAIAVRRGDTSGPGFPGVAVSLSGKAFGEGKTILEEATNEEGVATFGPVNPGVYDILIRAQDETTDQPPFHERARVTLYRGEPHVERQFVLPREEHAYLDFSSADSALAFHDDVGVLLELGLRWKNSEDSHTTEPSFALLTESGWCMASADLNRHNNSVSAVDIEQVVGRDPKGIALSGFDEVRVEELFVFGHDRVSWHAFAEPFPAIDLVPGETNTFELALPAEAEASIRRRLWAAANLDEAGDVAIEMVCALGDAYPGQRIQQAWPIAYELATDTPPYQPQRIMVYEDRGTTLHLPEDLPANSQGGTLALLVQLSHLHLQQARAEGTFTIKPRKTPYEGAFILGCEGATPLEESLEIVPRAIFDNWYVLDLEQWTATQTGAIPCEATHFTLAPDDGQAGLRSAVQLPDPKEAAEYPQRAPHLVWLMPDEDAEAS